MKENKGASGLDRIGQRDADRELWRARQAAKRARASAWGYSTGKRAVKGRSGGAK